MRSDNSFTMPLISRAYIVSAHHPAFPLAYTCMVTMSGSLVISVTVPGWMPLYRVVIAMQCTRVQFLTQLAYQTLIVVIVLAFFNSLEGYSLDPVFDQNTLQDSGKL